MNSKKIALYGAGRVGQDYYSQMKKSSDGIPVIWVDKNHKNYSDRFPVYPVEMLKNEKFDNIIIAIEDENIAKSAREELAVLGFNEDIILWEKPYRMY